MAFTAKLFKDKPPTGYENPQGLAPFLVPKGNSKNVNVVGDYKWTLTPKGGRGEAPYAVLTEFRTLDSALINSARYYATGALQAGIPQNVQTAFQEILKYAEAVSASKTKNVWLKNMTAYAGLCDWKNPTGFWYTLPYFGEISNEVSSTWTSLDIVEKIKTGLGNLSRDLAEGVELGLNATRTIMEANYPRVGVMDRPKLWESSTPRNINIRFPLFNTHRYEDIQDNWELCFLLLYQNMFNKKNFVTAIPPVFYTVHIPGQYFSIAAYVSDLKVYNRGNMRQISVNGKNRNIPDVYEINMTLTDIIMPSQNMQLALLNESPVTVQDIRSTI
jgi:hypothetical protein